MALIGLGHQTSDDGRVGRHLALSPKRRRPGQLSDSPGDCTPSHRLPESGADHRVMMMNGGRRQALAEPGPVGPIEVLGRELAQSDRPQQRGDALQVQFVAADRAGLAQRGDVLQPSVEELAQGGGTGDGCIAGLDLGDELGQLGRRLPFAALEGARQLDGGAR